MIHLDESKPYVRYALDITDGRIRAGKYVKAACRRFLDDFGRDDLVFRYDIVDRVIAFAHCLKHFNAPDSAINGRNIELLPWMQFATANIYGFYRLDGSRRYTNSYIEVARKNAKTMIASIMALYSTISGGKSSSNQSLLTSNTREQAGRLYEFIEHYSRQLDPSGKTLQVYRDRIKVKDNGSFCLVLSSDYKSADGFNATFAVVDECHEMVSTAGPDVIRSGMVNNQAHMMLITTAGFDIESPCYAYRSVCTDVVLGNKTDDGMFVLIYGLDPDMDWKDRDNWICASPSIGASAPWGFYNDSFQSSLNSPTQEINFKTKNLNFWLRNRQTWIPDQYIEDVTAEVDMTKWKDELIFMGIDAGSTHDITAVSYMFPNPESGIIEFRTEYYLPESVLDESENKEFYKRMYREGHLKLTNGNVTDYQQIETDILANQEKYGYRVFCLGYDQWNITNLIINLTNSGVRCKPASQALGAMNRPTREIERLIYSKKCVIDNNPITRWMFSNVNLRTDSNGNCKPSKPMDGKGFVSAKKIDGVIGMLNALMMLLEEGRAIYLQMSENEDDAEAAAGNE